MNIAGFSFIRNAVKYDYPVVESIRSVLPLCDMFYLAVGSSEDSTEELIRSIGSDKIVIIPTVWDDKLREGGKVLAVETDKAFQSIPAHFDWAFYIQGDEVLHEDGIGACRQAMTQYRDDPSVQGFVFKYRHFYGSYDFVGSSGSWYRHEVRIIRNDKRIFSWRDAQGFRTAGDTKLRVRPVDAWIHHYGWVKPPAAMQRKQESFNKLWHDDAWVEACVAKADEFDYSKIDALGRFTGTHPNVMIPRIKAMNWSFEFDPSYSRRSVKDRCRDWVERFLGVRPFEYRNYTT